MPDSDIKTSLMDAMKQSMRDKDKARLGAVRLALAAIKQIEVDDRIELADDQVIAVLDKMVKQRLESIKQFELANRDELAAVEKDEISVLREFLPQPLNEEEVNTIVAEAISSNNATTIKDMGRVMNAIRPQLAGRADMGSVSTLIKKLLA
ncbi:MAG: GatB/YqeY domain-containing protein [Gammaproteobacteria bacterium]|nr:GatB/YqeY domain-containing protein [Gammaproteobacteria bacterium]MDG2119027.1 GatB/YqeY domain-containing protein [Gammaproteobacteria bacterium]